MPRIGRRHSAHYCRAGCRTPTERDAFPVASSSYAAQSADVWLTYHDESDAAAWAVSIAAVLPMAVDRFLELPPGWFDAE